MTYPELSRYAAFGIGGLQLLANGASCLRGISRLPDELAKEGATVHMADLLRTAWVYGTLGNLCISVVLLCIAGSLRTGEPLARQVATAIGAYYILVGVATYLFAASRHPALLLFAALGSSLLATLWLAR
jgi:hypothetical protein